MFDVAIIVFLVLSVLWGYLRGALHDLLGLASLAVAYVVSAPFGTSLGGLLAQHSGLSSAAAYVVARVAAGVAIFVSLKISASVVNVRFGKDETGVTLPWNRNLGALMGLMFGLVLVLIVLFLSDSLYKAFPDSQNVFVREAAASRLRRWTGAHNPADRYLVTDLLRLLRAARQDREVLVRLTQDERVKALMEEPSLKAVLEDTELVEAIQDEQFDLVFENANLKRLLKDRQLMLRIVSPDYPPDLRTVIQEVMEERKRELEESEGPSGE